MCPRSPSLGLYSRDSYRETKSPYRETMSSYRETKSPSVSRLRVREGRSPSKVVIFIAFLILSAS